MQLKASVVPRKYSKRSRSTAAAAAAASSASEDDPSSKHQQLQHWQEQQQQQWQEQQQKPQQLWRREQARRSSSCPAHSRCMRMSRGCGERLWQFWTLLWLQVSTWKGYRSAAACDGQRQTLVGCCPRTPHKPHASDDWLPACRAPACACQVPSTLRPGAASAAACRR